MPPPVQSVTNDVETRLRAAVVEARLRKAVESAKGLGASSAPRNIGPPRIDSNRERITGKADPYEPTVNIPVEELGDPWRPGRETAFFGNAGNALTLGNLDKIGALPALMPGGETYDEARMRARNTLSMAREDYPVTSFGGDLAGFVAPGMVAGKAVNALARPAVMAAQRASPALGFGAKVTNAAAQGATGAAAYGATVGAENQAADQGRLDPTLGERGQLAADYAPMGAVFGAGLQFAAPALRPLGRAASGAVAYVGEKLGLTPGSIGRNAAKVGRDAALRSLERAGIVTVEDFLKRAAKYGDKPVVTGELGQDPLNSLVSLVRSKGTTGDKAQAVLEDRVAGLPGRLLKDLADETGISPEEIYGSIDDLVKSSRAAAAPKYEAAEAAPFAETANLERIIRDSPILRKFMPTAVNRVQHQAVDRIGQADQMPPLKVYDELKQLVDEEINRRIAKGEGIDDIEGVRKALVAELDLISGQAATGAEAPPAGASLYAQAREAGGDAPRIASAFRTGEAMMGGRFNAAQVEREIAQLTGTPLTAAQQGVVRNIVTQVERGNLTPKRVKTVEFRKKLEAVFGKPAADGIIRKFGTEAELQVKGSRWNPNVGSVTSQAQMGGPSKLGDEIVKGAANALTGNKIGLATQAINMLRRQGYSENQLNALGDIFLSSPDDAAKLLYPGKTPRPGSVPPPVPPAGQRRTNPPPTQGPPKSGTGEGARPASGASEEYIDVYHASPHDFDQFEFSPRTSRTGEGAQTFGSGLYFSENPATHASYMERFGKGTVSYEARIKVKPDELIDFDKTLAEQPKLKQVIADLSPNPTIGARLTSPDRPYWQDALQELKQINRWDDAQLNDALKSKGFKGIRYLDAGSRQKGAGTRNYVIFDDKVVETTRKNKPEPAQASSPTPKVGESTSSFDTSIPLYRGRKSTGDDYSFKVSTNPENNYGDGIYLSTEQDFAKAFTGERGSVVSAFANGKIADLGKMPDVKRAFDQAWEAGDYPRIRQLQQQLRSQGYDGLKDNIEVVIFDPKNLRRADAPTPKQGEGKGPPRNALRDETRGPRQRFNTRSSIRDAPKEYRDVVMNAPEGIAQSVWDSVRKSTGNRLPSPNALQYRVREIELKGNPTAAELRELKALKEMKRRLEKLNLKYD